MKREIKISEIKPFGNLGSVFETLDTAITKCERDGYSKRVGDLIKHIVDFGLVDTKDWFDEIETEEDRPEIEMIVLLGQICIIRLNNIAQKHINNIELGPIANQLNDNAEVKKYFKNVTFI